MQSNKNNSYNFSTLPKMLKNTIFSLLDPKDLVSVSQVNKSFNKYVKDSQMLDCYKYMHQHLPVKNRRKNVSIINDLLNRVENDLIFLIEKTYQKNDLGKYTLIRKLNANPPRRDEIQFENQEQKLIFYIFYRENIQIKISILKENLSENFKKTDQEIEKNDNCLKEILKVAGGSKITPLKDFIDFLKRETNEIFKDSVFRRRDNYYPQWGAVYLFLEDEVNNTYNKIIENLNLILKQKNIQEISRKNALISIFKFVENQIAVNHEIHDQQNEKIEKIYPGLNDFQHLILKNKENLARVSSAPTLFALKQENFANTFRHIYHHASMVLTPLVLLLHVLPQIAPIVEGHPTPDEMGLGIAGIMFLLQLYYNHIDQQAMQPDNNNNNQGAGPGI